MNDRPSREQEPEDTAQAAVEVMRVATGESDEKPHRRMRVKVEPSKGKKRRKRKPLEGFPTGSDV